MYTPIKDWAGRERVLSKDGYFLVKVPEHPKSFAGWYYEHRLVVEARLNRLLRSYETIHHIGIKTDNSDRNLFLCTWKEHERLNRYDDLTRRS
jgi:hypothetical protein